MKLFRVLTLLTGVAVTISLLPGQQQSGTPRPGGTGGGPPGGATPGGPGNTGNGMPGNNSPMNTNSPFPNEPTRSIFLTGKVAMSDGTSLPGPAVIQRVCNGIPHSEAHTDGKGRFSFQVGQNQEVSLDVSEPTEAFPRGAGRAGNPAGGIRESELSNCELTASLPGYRADSIPLFNHRSLDNPDVGTILLHRMANVEGLTTSATAALAPKDARKALEKGIEAARKGQPDEAQKQLEKAVSIYPKYATAWDQLGRLFDQRGHPDQARNAYAQALAADSKYLSPYEGLYMIAFKEAKWQELADTTDKVIRLDPFDYPGAYYYNGVANLQLNQLEAAEKSIREAIKLDPGNRNPKTNYVLGVILVKKRDFSGASESLRAYLKTAPNAPDAEVVRKQLVQMESFLQSDSQR